MSSARTCWRKPQPGAERRIEQAQRLGDDAAEEPGALAAADDEEPHRLVAGLEVGRAGRSRTAAHRIADVDGARALGHGVGQVPQATRATLRREDAVDPAEDAVLLVDQRAGSSGRTRRSSPASPDSRRSRRRPPAGRGAWRGRVAAAPAAMAKGAVARFERRPWAKVAAGVARRSTAAGKPPA